MDALPNVGRVIGIRPPRTVLLWWDGMPHQDLLSFDDAGYALMYASLGGSLGFQQDVVQLNIKLFLDDYLAMSRHDFVKDGPILLDEPKVKRLLKIKVESDTV